MNDRTLRNIEVYIDKKKNKGRREFVITAASEIMALFCLSKNMEELKENISNAIVGKGKDGLVKVKDIKAHSSAAVLLVDALKPNLVQTTEGVPAIIHGGPFANIAHGTNSIVATNYALEKAEYVITEAGFGSDLGGEKFFNIVSRKEGFEVYAVVLVATLKALKYHGNGDIEKGFENLLRHVKNMENFNVKVVVALNIFDDDSEEDKKKFAMLCKKHDIEWGISKAYSKGGEGAMELAKKIIESGEKKKHVFTYDLEDSIRTKIEKVVKKVYGGVGVKFSEESEEMLKIAEKYYSKLPICIAKTQYSFSDDPKLINAPSEFEITIREIRISAGAGFVVAIAGKIMTMPGLPKHPSAENIDFVDRKIIGVKG